MNFRNVMLILLGAAWIPVEAQNPPSPIKIGYVDVGQVLENLPDSKKVEAQMKEIEKKLIEHVDGKTNELKQKYDLFVKNEKTMPEAVRNSTINELQQLQANLEQLKQDAQTSLNKKHAELMQPVYDKIGKAIEAVAKEAGYTFILNSGIQGQDVVIFADPAFELSSAVLKKLGVTPEGKQ